VIEDRIGADILPDGDETAGMNARGRLVEGMTADGKGMTTQLMPATQAGKTFRSASVPPEPADAATSARPRTENS
jgi:hypothetical protein